MENTLCALGSSIQQSNESDMSNHKDSILKTRELQAGVQYYVLPHNKLRTVTIY
jgi:hypothetical protein